jgi:hypothetical protein
MKSSDNWDPFRVCLKETDNCEAVLCTSHETYLIRQADTFNTLLVNDSFSLNSNNHQKVKNVSTQHSEK